MTQDVHQGQFTITTDNPIPLMPYSHRYTWAKYGHFILHSGISPTDNTAAGSDDESLTNQNKQAAADHNNSLTVNHCDCLISFLWTDPDGAASFIVDASSTCLIDEFLNNTFQTLTKRTKKGYFCDELIEKNAYLIVSSISVIAKEATKIPLAIITDLFHHGFKKKDLLGINVGNIAAVLQKTCRSLRNVQDLGW
jgi:hypothetical protein